MKAFHSYFNISEIYLLFPAILRIFCATDKSLLKTKWYYNIFGTTDFGSDLATRIIPFVIILYGLMNTIIILYLMLV